MNGVTYPEQPVDGYELVFYVVSQHPPRATSKTSPRAAPAVLRLRAAWTPPRAAPAVLRLRAAWAGEIWTVSDDYNERDDRAHRFRGWKALQRLYTGKDAYSTFGAARERGLALWQQRLNRLCREASAVGEAIVVLRRVSESDYLQRKAE